VLGNGVRSPVSRGGFRAHLLDSEPPPPTRAERRGSRGAGHVAVPEPSHLGSRGPELWGSWWCVDAHPALGPNLQLIRGGTQSVGYRQCWRSHKIMFVQHKQFIVNMFNQ
jgi:hypothetical protein